jgi:hypothetical protein
MGLALSLTPHALAVWIRPLASGLCVVSDKILNPVSTKCFIARTVVRFPGASNSGRAQSQSCCAKPRAKGHGGALTDLAAAAASGPKRVDSELR